MCDHPLVMMACRTKGQERKVECVIGEQTWLVHEESYQKVWTKIKLMVAKSKPLLLLVTLLLLLLRRRRSNLLLLLLLLLEKHHHHILE